MITDKIKTYLFDLDQSLKNKITDTLLNQLFYLINEKKRIFYSLL